MNDEESEDLTGTETNEPLHDFLDTLYKSACIIAGVALSTTDTELRKARDEMQVADATIDQLHKLHGNEADGRDDYLQTEAQRDEALDVLATVPATSQHGMIAKAQALSEKRLIEDWQGHGKIAVSLASDVLRCFGAATA
jgi:hypothetical protein